MSTLIRHADPRAFAPAERGIHIRDFDINEATGGDYMLLLVRIEPQGARVEHLHRHDEGFSLAYVLRGWLDVEFREIGRQHLARGTVVPAFNAPTHRELDAGDGLELLLLVTPKNLADYEHEKIILQREGEVVPTTTACGGLRCRDFGLHTLTAGRMRGNALHAGSGSQGGGEIKRQAGAMHISFVAEGWCEAVFEDAGRVRLEAGAMALQRSGHGHVITAHSDNLLLIEMAVDND